MVSVAQKRATKKFEAANYSKVLLRIRNDTEPTRDSIQAAANEAGESLNGYILKAVKQRMEGGDLVDGQRSVNPL